MIVTFHHVFYKFLCFYTHFQSYNLYDTLFKSKQNSLCCACTVKPYKITLSNDQTMQNAPSKFIELNSESLNNTIDEILTYVEEEPEPSLKEESLESSWTDVNTEMYSSYDSKNSTSSENIDMAVEKISEEDLENEIKFDPPAFRQRYGQVYDILIEEKWRKNIKKIVDFGCSEFGLFIFIKRLISVNEIYMIDIDEDLLESNLWKLRPLTIEYLKRRDLPLSVSVLCGSVSDPDYHLSDTDAVTCIELIEHLYPDVLEAFPYNIFGYICPRLVIITTPNADFNVLFNKMDKFRHYDHKFEWSREQFQDWCLNIVSRFPDYEVEFTGIAEGPIGTEDYGCCSQMALFIRKNDYPFKDAKVCQCPVDSTCKQIGDNFRMTCNCLCSTCMPAASWGICTYSSRSKQFLSSNDKKFAIVPCCNMYYHLMETIEYPFEDDQRSQEEKLIDEFRYRINYFGGENSRFFNDETNRAEIPLTQVLCGVDGASLTKSELNKLLLKIGYKTEECFLPETQQIEICVLYESVMDDFTSSSEASGYSSSDCTKNAPIAESVSDWEDSATEEKDPKSGTSKTKKESTLNAKQSEADKDETPSLIEVTNKEDFPDIRDMQKSSSTLDSTFHSVSDDTEAFQDANTSLVSLDSDVRGPPKKDFVMNAVVSLLPELNLSKLDVNRINELDSFGNQNQYYQFPCSRAFTHNLVRKPPDVKKFHYKDSLPGPSNIKRRKKFKITWSSESDEDSAINDVRSITNCLLENTLNKLEINDDNKSGQDGLIELNIQDVAEQKPIIALSPTQETLKSIPTGTVEDLNTVNEILQGVVNYAIENAEAIKANEHMDEASSNLEEIHQANSDSNIDSSISRASREALVDPNSQVDLLEDFEIPSPIHEAPDIREEQEIPNRLGSIIIIGVREIPDNEQPGANPEEEEGEDANGSHDEPHFYCQGDGLGVHPSVIAVDINEEEDADSESTSNDTEDFAEVDPGTSEPEGLSLPEDTLQANSSNFIPPEPIEEQENENLNTNNDSEECCDTPNDLNINSTSK